MAVPKCKTCNCIWDVPVADYSEKNNHFCHWWCMADFNGSGGKINIFKTGHQGTNGKPIISQEYKTSPKWCPRRSVGMVR